MYFTFLALDFLDYVFVLRSENLMIECGSLIFIEPIVWVLLVMCFHLITNLRKMLAAKFFSSSHDEDHCKVEFIQSCVGFIPCQICL